MNCTRPRPSYGHHTHPRVRGKQRSVADAGRTVIAMMYSVQNLSIRVSKELLVNKHLLLLDFDLLFFMTFGEE